MPKNEQELLDKMGEAITLLSEVSRILISIRKEKNERLPARLILIGSREPQEDGRSCPADPKKLLIRSPDDGT